MNRLLSLAMALAWVGGGYATEEITIDLPNGAAMEFVWIEPGTFTMGDSFYGPAHQVTITQGFYLGKYEITQDQWEAVMGTKPWSGQENPDPVVNISWNDLQEFIHKLNQVAEDSLYRLPTEAEWEYACRAGTTMRWSFGDDKSQLKDYAWFLDNAGSRVHGVGTKKPNPWGLYDMHGNAWEWVQDWYGSYSGESQVDPQGPSNGSDRVVRGGGIYANAARVWSTYREHANPSFRNPDGDLGARLLRMGPKITAVTSQSWGEVKGQSH